MSKDQPNSSSHKDLPEREVEVTCFRCRRNVLADSSALGMTVGTVETPATGGKLDFVLCGRCGLELKEFIVPALADDPDFPKAKAALLESWS